MVSMDIINSLFVFIQKNLIALISLIISIFVAYKNFIKPFKLNVRYKSKVIFWVNNGFLRADFPLSFFNSGTREGVIENISFTIRFKKQTAIFEAEYYYRLTKDHTLELDDFWMPLFLKGKESISKTVGFKSNIQIENVNDENTNVLLEIYFKNKLSAKRTKIKKIEIPILINIQEAMNRSQKKISQ